MARKPQDLRRWIDPNVVYSRQEIAERTGLSDDVLSFWIKRRLLVPEGPVAGKGIHHKFHYSQIGIAVILKALRDHFGANIGTLKSLADRLQQGCDEFRRTKADVEAWSAATRMAEDLASFRSGDPPMITPYDDHAGTFVSRRPAASEAEIIGWWLSISDAQPAVVVQLAEKLGPSKSTDYEIALAILGLPLDPRFVGDNYWLLANRNGTWTIRSDSDEWSRDRSDVGPAMFLPVYSMLRQAWGIPSELRSLDEAKRLELVLADAGIQCKITPTDGEGSAQFDAEECAMGEISRIIERYHTPDWQLEKLGEEPLRNRYEDAYWLPSDDAKR